MSNAVSFAGQTLPFNVSDMVSTAMNFLLLHSYWVTLSLGVLFAPVVGFLALKLVNSVSTHYERTKIAKAHIQKYGGGETVKEFKKRNWQ